jgi:hypothetical protein
MEQHELEIEIGRDGKVRATVRGAKGKVCLEYAKLLEELVGREEGRELTAEYYEPETACARSASSRSRNAAGNEASHAARVALG